MKIKQLFSTAVLTVALSCSAFAGDTWVPGITDPPPTGGGRVACSVSQTKVTAIDILTEAALLLYRSMLSVF